MNWKRIPILLLMILSLLFLSGCDVVYELLDLAEILLGESYPQEVEIDPDGMRLVFMDVGQADCTLILQGEHAMLVDTGTAGEYETIAGYLDRYGVRELDALILTHPHADHIGSAPKILEDYSVHQVFLPGATTTTKVFERTLDLILEQEIPADAPTPGDTWQLGKATLTFLSPDPDEEFSDLNDASIAFIIDYNGIGAFFSGDMGSAMEKEVIGAGYYLACDLIKVPHHGSRTASCQELVDAVNPRYAVFTTEANSDDGLPDEDVIERYEEQGTTLYFSHLDGTILADISGTELLVYPENESNQ